MLSSSLCRCICGASGKLDGLHNQALDRDFDGLFQLDERQDPEPQCDDHGVHSYITVLDQPLRGTPVHQGELWYLLAEEKIEAVTFLLYVNGFSFKHDDREVSISLSPFSLVRNCKFQESRADANLSEMKIFKISLFTQGICYYYGVKGADEKESEDLRSRWVIEISRAIRMITQSLFPPFSISVKPLGSAMSTQRRLMAGYLLYHDDTVIASVLYCELHPHCNGQAKLALYENELCKAPVMDIWITERTACCEKAGINCSCFCVDCHQFSTRTFSERKLWLRAISNLKVKLQNHAPSPTVEELSHYRMAIEEHVLSIKNTLEGRAPTDPLLRRLTRKTQPADSPPGASAVGPVSASRVEEEGLSFSQPPSNNVKAVEVVSADSRICEDTDAPTPGSSQEERQSSPPVPHTASRAQGGAWPGASPQWGHGESAAQAGQPPLPIEPGGRGDDVASERKSLRAELAPADPSASSRAMMLSPAEEPGQT